MLVGYFKDSFYKRLAELQTIDNGKPKELALIENDQWNEAKELQLWKMMLG
jgi:hypothetical protein